VANKVHFLLYYDFWISDFAGTSYMTFCTWSLNDVEEGTLRGVQFEFLLHLGFCSRGFP